ncbi:MAG: cytochrome c peroxidase [Hylemonella sp.]|nr:cytochrome c peroxidase [Hylemonella sp.]
MPGTRIAGLAAICLAGMIAGFPPARAAAALVNDRELDASSLSMLASFGPWPPKIERDTSNPYSGNARAIRLGQRLFADPGLSGSARISCASCHQPGRHFTDGSPLSLAGREPRRHTPSLMDARFQRWFGWAGSNDSLWAASLQPFLDANEMGPERMAPRYLKASPGLWADYLRVVGARQAARDETGLLVDMAKILAAFQETLVSPRTPFDAYRDAVLAGDGQAAAPYPLQAVRGYKLFVGKARCVICHSGPTFSHQEFDKVGIPVRTGTGLMDGGRYDGAKSLLASRFNALREHAAGVRRERVELTRHASTGVDMLGLFRVPGLRGLSKTAPYMHNGSLSSLPEVVQHYSTLDEVRIAMASPHAHNDLDITARPPASTFFSEPLHLTPQEIQDLVSFLETLSPP